MAGMTEALQREIDAWCSNKVELYPTIDLAKANDSYVAHRIAARGWLVDPREAEITQLHRLLSDAKKGATETRRLLTAAHAQRDAAIYERDIALRALAEMIQHFMYPPAPAPAEEDPAVRAVRVMQAKGVR